MSTSAETSRFDSELVGLFEIIRTYCSSEIRSQTLGNVPAHLEALITQHPLPGHTASSIALAITEEKIAAIPITLDVETFPHILELITSYSDRQTLTSLARVSKFVQNSAMTALYPKRLVDPFQVPIRDQLGPDFSFIFTGNETTSAMSDERGCRKLESFLTSSHLPNVEEIVITNPALWGTYLKKMGRELLPVARGEGTITTVCITVPGMGKEVRWDSRGIVIPNPGWKKRKSKKKGEASYASAIKEEVGNLGPEEAVRRAVATQDPSWDAEPIIQDLKEWSVVQAALTIARLIPSSQLALTVPHNSGADLSAIVTYVPLNFDPPAGMRKLTLIYGSGNIFGIRGQTDVNQFNWDEVELLFAPDPLGNWTRTMTCTGDPEDEDEAYLRTLFVSCVTLPSLPMKAEATFDLIGLDRVRDGAGKWDKETIKRDMLECAHQHSMIMRRRRPEEMAQIKFTSMKSWRRSSPVSAALDLL